MRIECPSCDTAYDVPGEGLEGRMVRCARCNTDWQPVPDAPAPPMPPEPLPVIDEPLPPVASERPFLSPAAPSRQDRMVPASPDATQRPRRAPVVAAWAMSAVLIAAIAAGAVTRRDAVMRAWPPSERLYAALGLVAPSP